MAPRSTHPAHARKLTYQDYVTLPDDGRRYEILDGELAVSPAPLTVHQHVCGMVAHALIGWVTEKRLGRVLIAPCDVIFDQATVVQPDILYVSTPRSSIITRRAVEGVPDLVVEILSDATRQRDRSAKKALYARYGVSRYWIIDPEARTFEVYALHDNDLRPIGTYRDDDVVSCDVPAGLELSLGAVWVRP